MSAKSVCAASSPAMATTTVCARSCATLVLFAHHDLLKDPPFSRVDLISCRNVMIYLDRELQEQVIGTFDYALKPGDSCCLVRRRPPTVPAGCSASSTAMPGSTNRPQAPATSRACCPGCWERSMCASRSRRPAARPTRRPHSTTRWRTAARWRSSRRRGILVDETHRVVHLSDSAPGAFCSPPAAP